ncbi:Integrase core domain protein [Trichostrongylus colubriformis]|uniref:Integrase core domain protein n=1 Tax=Trichostrongylus colubriformis TaxID=6319 RepID=A0AAN8F6Q9_TRICO
MLRTYINNDQTNWDVFLPACTLAYSTSVHSATNESPFFLMFGRDPILNIELLIKHRRQGHIPSEEDHSIYKKSLISTLHDHWAAAAAFNRQRNEVVKRKYDKKQLPPLNIKAGDRVYLRDYTSKPGLSSKLCYPWLGQFRVVSVDHPHLTIVSITASQARPNEFRLNLTSQAKRDQVKRCFTLSGPVFTSPWRPETETRALDTEGARTVALVGYNHSPLSPQQFDTIHNFTPKHPYNTRFRSRLSSV